MIKPKTYHIILPHIWFIRSKIRWPERSKPKEKEDTVYLKGDNHGRHIRRINR